MSKNRTLRDFIVKGATIKIKVGNQWVRPNTPPIPGEKYRLQVICGNANGRIDWGNEGDYNKVMLQVRVVPVGFKHGNNYIHKYKVEFYTNSSFTQKVHRDSDKNYRTSFTLPEFKPTHADIVKYLYLKFEPNTPSIYLRNLYWQFGIYGAVRNHNWKKRYTTY